MRLATTIYKFHPDTENEAVLSADEFKKSLLKLDVRLSQMRSPVVIPPTSFDLMDFDIDMKGSVGQGVHGRSPSMQLIPLEDIVRCVCF